MFLVFIYTIFRFSLFVLIFLVSPHCINPHNSDDDDHHPGHNRYTLNTDQCPPHQSLLSTGPKECQEVSEARICPSIAISSFKVSSRFCPLYHCLSFQCHHCVKRIKGKFTFPILRNRRDCEDGSFTFVESSPVELERYIVMVCCDQDQDKLTSTFLAAKLSS